MLFRNSVSVGLLSSGLFLAACNSSDSPTSGSKDPDPGTAFKPNGTLTVDGGTFPAHVSGVFGDSSVTLTVLANLNAVDGILN